MWPVMGVAAQQRLRPDEDVAGENTGSVGADIRALRKNRSLTLTELADRLGRSVGFISQIERGISEPSINDLRNIAEVFDVPLSFLFGENRSDPAEAKYIVGPFYVGDSVVTPWTKQDSTAFRFPFFI